MQKDCRAPGAPWLTPYLIVKDAKAASEFYQKAFGLTQKEASTDDKGHVMHVELTYHDALIMLGAECTYDGIEMKSPASLKVHSPIGLYLYCEDVDAFHKRAVAAGATCLMAPTDMFWGDRYCKLRDPDGHIWSFGTHTGKMSENPYCCGNKKSCDRE